jgi:hypothetical protein
MMTGSGWLSNDILNRLDNDDRFWLTVQWYKKQTIDNDDRFLLTVQWYKKQTIDNDDRL